MNNGGTSGSLGESVSEDDEISVSSAGTVSSTSTKQKSSYPPIPWEYGTNRCASQKGMSAFGSPRNVVTKITSTRPAPSGGEGIVPKLCGGGNSFPTPGKFQPFGDTRDVVRKTEENNEKKPVNMASASRQTDTFLSRWATPNPNAKNSGIGKPRRTTMEIHVKKDQRSEGVLPRLQYTVGALPGTGSPTSHLQCSAGKDCRRARIENTQISSTQPFLQAAFQSQRQVTTKVEGLDFSYDDETKSKAAVPWATGRLGMQTQSGTGGFLKPRDVCNMTYYDEKKPMSSYKFL